MYQHDKNQINSVGPSFPLYINIYKTLKYLDIKVFFPYKPLVKYGLTCMMAPSPSTFVYFLLQYIAMRHLLGECDICGVCQWRVAPSFGVKGHGQEEG